MLLIMLRSHPPLPPPVPPVPELGVTLPHLPPPSPVSVDDAVQEEDVTEVPPSAVEDDAVEIGGISGPADSDAASEDSCVLEMVFKASVVGRCACKGESTLHMWSR